MYPIRIVIVDDERLVRRDIASVVKEFPNTEIIGEADSVEAAEQLLSAMTPDLVLLDIHMPPRSGFDVVEYIQPETTDVVFVTAFDRYAIRAFDVHSLDYLLKPIKAERFSRTLERVQTNIRRRQQESVFGNNAAYEVSEQLSLAKIALIPDLSYADHILAKLGRKQRLIPLKEICYFQSIENYTEIVTVQGSIYPTTRSLKDWEQCLPNDFMRVHRAYIVNVHYVERIRDNPNYTKELYLRPLSKAIPISRRWATEWRKRFPIVL